MNLSGSETRSSLISGASAVAGVIAALSCCLPTGALLAAAGFAGVSGFFSTAQPYLLGFAVLCLAWGFAQALRAQQCPPRRRTLNLAVLAVSAALVIPALVFPQQTAAFLADSVVPRGRPPQGQPPLATLDVAALRQAFNDAVAQRRVIALFSPT